MLKKTVLGLKKQMQILKKKNSPKIELQLLTCYIDFNKLAAHSLICKGEKTNFKVIGI